MVQRMPISITNSIIISSIVEHPFYSGFMTQNFYTFTHKTSAFRNISSAKTLLSTAA